MQGQRSRIAGRSLEFVIIGVVGLLSLESEQTALLNQ